jgi:hypothetical protein
MRLQVSQNLCKMHAKAAYRWAQTGMCGNMHAIFAALLQRRRGFPATDCYRWGNMVAPLWTFKQTSKHRVETHIIAQEWCLCCFGDLMGPSSSTAKMVHRWSVVHSIVLCLKRRWNLLFAVNTVEHWQREFCIMTTLDLTWKQWPLKWFENQNLSFSPTHHTVQISLHLITIFLDCLKMCYMDDDLHTMKKSRTWCICASAHSQNILYTYQEACGPK